jgi:DNA-binding NarL/FixJ family response regulator
MDEPAEEGIPDPTPCRILLVEDDDGDAELVTWALRRQALPYVLDRVATLEGCLTACSRGDFDVILMDLNLPGVDDFSGVETVRELAPGAAIIVLTGFDDPSAAERTINAGAQEYLNKNVGVNELCRSIHSAMKRTRLSPQS